MDRACDIELPRLLSSWLPDRGAREVRRALTSGERRALQARADALGNGLAGYHPSERKQVEAQIGAMLGGFRSMRQQDADARGAMMAAAAALREFPLWAISKACLMIARNEAGLDRRFAPNDAELSNVVRNIVRGYRKRLATVEVLLAAPVEPSKAAPAAKLTPEQIATKLGRPVGTGSKVEAMPSASRSDGGHAARVAADLAARRARRQSDPPREATE